MLCAFNNSQNGQLGETIIARWKEQVEFFRDNCQEPLEHKHKLNAIE